MQLIALAALTDNYIWLQIDAKGHALIVDPGEAAPVLTACAQGIVPRAILITHHHADHLAGVATIRAHYPFIRVYGPEHPLIAADIVVRDGDVIPLGDSALTVIAVPGHTHSHLAYYGAPHLFCGDTLFSLGCGRIFEGNADTLFTSLQRLSQLPGSTLVCCGHEYSQANARFATAVDSQNLALLQRCEQIHALRHCGKATVPVRLDEELATNPFLRCHTPAVQASVMRHFSQTEANERAIFTSLRRWKDQFRSEI